MTPESPREPDPARSSAPLLRAFSRDGPTTTVAPEPCPPQVSVSVHLSPDDLGAALRDDVRRGLCGSPKELSPKWLYDERGCELFEEITRLPEYYPTRCEREILATRAGDIAALSDADTLVELGSGTSEKTRLLLDAMAAAGTLLRFAPFDVAEPTLRDTATMIPNDYPGIEVAAVVGDFERHLHHLPVGGRRLIAFLGGTIGNLDASGRFRLLADLVATMAPGDTFLLGTDLLKDPERLVRAYDDTAGVTADFNRNVLTVINRELGATFELDRFEHVARFDEENGWIEMRLRAVAAHDVSIGDLALTIGFEVGEEIRTEISAKFTREQVCGELEEAGLEPIGWWTDEAGDFALSLARR